MEKLLLVGAGGFGRVTLEHAMKIYDCVFLDDGIEVGTKINGIPVVGKLDDIANLYGEYHLLVATIGNNKLRESIYEKASEIGYSFPNIVVSSAYISPFATIGQGCVILNNAVVQNNSHVGSGTILNPGVEIHHDSMVGDNVLIYTNSVVRSLTHIGNRVWIGSTVTISTGANVADDTIVSDGTVVTE